jgi:hypothetical protein
LPHKIPTSESTLNLQLSHKYRSLEEYLIPQAQWTTKRTEYLQRANLLRFMHGPLTLRDLQRTMKELGYQLLPTNTQTPQEAAGYESVAK